MAEPMDVDDYHIAYGSGGYASNYSRKRKRQSSYAPSKRARTTYPSRMVHPQAYPPPQLDAATIANVLAASQGYIRGPVGGYRFTDPRELRWFDTLIPATPIPTTGTVLKEATANKSSLNNITQGTGAVQRLGRKCAVTHVGLNLNILAPSLDTELANIRIVLVLDRQANGSVPAWNAIFTDVDFLTFANKDNEMRFDILIDKTYTLSPKVGQDTGGAQVNLPPLMVKFLEYKFKKPLEIEFNGTDGINDEIRSNNLLLFAISSSAFVQVQGRTRVRFYP